MRRGRRRIAPVSGRFWISFFIVLVMSVFYWGFV